MFRWLRRVWVVSFVALMTARLGAQSPRPALTVGVADSVWSPTLKEWRRYQVYLPPGYAQSVYAPRAYPVVYLLDGNLHFHSFTGLVQFLSNGMNGNYVIPEMIVVAISNTNRIRDLSPTRAVVGYDGKPAADSGSTGGGDAFLRFMRDELIPRVDSAYRVEPYRIFIGHSLGGLMAIRALYTMPETYNAYIAIDPSLWWDNKVLLRDAQAQLARPALRGRMLYVAAANTVDLQRTDPAGPCEATRQTGACADTIMTNHYRTIRAFDRVAQRARSGLRYRFRYYPDEDHGSVPLQAEYDGLRFIFETYRLPISETLSVADVRAHFATVSAAQGYTVKPPEKMLVLLRGIIGKAPAALLELNRYAAELYPTSATAQEGVGAALLQNHDTTAAVAAYQRALTLAPDNPRIKATLAQLKPR